MAFASSKRGAGGFQPLAEMNVTPLVDVMLVLLIIFMVTAPMMAQGMKVTLPQARAGRPVSPKEPVVITIAKGGKLQLGPDEISLDHLIAAVTAKINGDLSHVIHLRGDKDAALGDMVALMDALANHGMTHIAILSMQQKGAKSAGKDSAP